MQARFKTCAKPIDCTYRAHLVIFVLSECELYLSSSNGLVPSISQLYLIRRNLWHIFWNTSQCGKITKLVVCKIPRIYNDELLVGNFTGKRLGGIWFFYESTYNFRALIYGKSWCCILRRFSFFQERK